ncbi:TPA: valine--pyruvate transaminase, partial [Neisseria subflava]
GIDRQDYPHAHECIRMSIAQDAETLEKGIAAIGRVVRGLYDKK